MKTFIHITGSYGDKVRLYFNGYVHTKYGGHFKIKVIDFEKYDVHLYGEEVLDFSRISYSSPDNGASRHEYTISLKQYFKDIKIKNDSLIEIKINDSIEAFKILDIIYPTLKDHDYLPKLKMVNLTDNSIIEYTINNLSEFNGMLSVKHTPYTLEEQIENIVNDNTDFTGKTLKDKDKFINDIILLINTNKNN